MTAVFNEIKHPNVPTEPYLNIGVLFEKPSNW